MTIAHSELLDSIIEAANHVDRTLDVLNALDPAALEVLHTNRGVLALIRAQAELQDTEILFGAVAS